MTAIVTLMTEHRLIERLLSALGSLAGRLEAKREVPPDLLGELLDLFQQYADGLHHTKEERHLFEIAGDRDAMSEDNAVRALIHQHDVGRTHVQDMRRELGRMGSGDKYAAAALASSARVYIELLREHIRAEDEDVFPLLAQVLSAEEDARLAAHFTDIDLAQRAADLQARAEAVLARVASLSLNG